MALNRSLGRGLGRLFRRLPNRTREDTPAEVQRLKLHPALLTALQRQVARNPGKATPEQVVDDWASVLTHRTPLEGPGNGAFLRDFTTLTSPYRGGGPICMADP